MTTETLTAALDAADKVVDDLCQGRRWWEMRVPAEPDHDPDLIISNALGLARDASAELDRLRAALRTAEAWLVEYHPNSGLLDVVVAALRDRTAEEAS